jgi:hypothetical protein
MISGFKREGNTLGSVWLLRELGSGWDWSCPSPALVPNKKREVFVSGFPFSRLNLVSFAN